jgi:hypothetical protein
VRTRLTKPLLSLGLAAITAALVARGHAAEPSPTNAPPDRILLTDSLGRTVLAGTNEVPQSMQPPAAVGLHQFSGALEGAKGSSEVLARLEEARASRVGTTFFPAIPPRLSSYLFGLDEYGNTVIRPGALITWDPFDVVPQQAKYWASEYGLRYSLDQTLTYVNMTHVVKGDNALSFYTLDLKAKWAVFDAPDAGTAGWLSAQFEVKTGLGGDNETQSPKSNLGMITDPAGIWSSINGKRVPELAWQQSFFDGTAVLVAGSINQENYLDKNAYAHTGRGQFLNSGLINSGVLPLKNSNFGLNLQWQPRDEWYAMAGASVGNAMGGQLPWTDFTWQNWSLIGEFGYAPGDFLGLGPGIYRIQPFVAQAGKPTQGGLCFNLQQELGPRSPFGWFGRFGFGGEEVTSGARAQVGTGFVLQAPLEHAGLVRRLSNDLLGLGVVWSQPSATTKTIYHENECVLDAFYALQLTPLLKLQPDIQYVWDPAFNRASNALAAQVQLVFSW